MRLFCMDLHISVIADFKSACPDVEVIDWCLSGHAWVMKRNQDRPEHINPSTWQDLSPERIARFQERYDRFLRSFDGFIVAHCAAFAMIYEKYQKPILMINSVRYDIPFCFNKDLVGRARWNACLQRLHSKGLLTIVSNNRADQLYTQLGTGITPSVLPSLCLYTNTRFAPTKSTFLSYGPTFLSHPLLTPKEALSRPYEWSDITSYRGIVNFPYEVSLMSVFEQFTAGCPLFFPSKAYWKANPHIQSISAYWGSAESMPREYAPLSTPEAWIELADMYTTFQSPNTHYFDSNEHLVHLLETFEYVDDREFRAAYIHRIKSEWSRILTHLGKHT